MPRRAFRPNLWTWLTVAAAAFGIFLFLNCIWHADISFRTGYGIWLSDGSLSITTQPPDPATSGPWLLGGSGFGIQNGEGIWPFSEFLIYAATPFQSTDYTLSGDPNTYTSTTISLWFPFLLLAAVVTLRFFWSRRDRFNTPGLCRRCGYPLASVMYTESEPTTCKCPECGAKNRSVHSPPRA